MSHTIGHGSAVSSRQPSNVTHSFQTPSAFLWMGHRRWRMAHLHAEPGCVHVGVHGVRQSARRGIRLESDQHHHRLGAVPQLGTTARAMARPLLRSLWREAADGDRRSTWGTRVAAHPYRDELLDIPRLPCSARGYWYQRCPRSVDRLRSHRPVVQSASIARPGHLLHWFRRGRPADDSAHERIDSRVRMASECRHSRCDDAAHHGGGSALHATPTRAVWSRARRRPGIPDSSADATGLGHLQAVSIAQAPCLPGARLLAIGSAPQRSLLVIHRRDLSALLRHGHYPGAPDATYAHPGDQPSDCDGRAQRFTRRQYPVTDRGRLDGRLLQQEVVVELARRRGRIGALVVCTGEPGAHRVRLDLCGALGHRARHAPAASGMDRGHLWPQVLRKHQLGVEFSGYVRPSGGRARCCARL